jgi:DNA-binding NtrC family response regulator
MTLHSTPDPILVVDDDAQARQVWQDLLEQAGHAAVAVAGAKEARRVSEEREPALTILDVALSDGDGVELLRELRSAWPAMPAIVVSGRREPRSVVEAMRAGATDYLTKPADPGTLLAACRTALASRGVPSHSAAFRPAWPAACAQLPPLREIEDAYIDHVLGVAGGNRTRAARILGVARETLRTRMLTRRGRPMATMATPSSVADPARRGANR